MTTYGRFGLFRASPTPQQRDGRCRTGNAAVPQFSPIKINAASTSGDGRYVVAVAAEGEAPTPNHGVLIWEEAYYAGYGKEPALFTSSDADTAPANTQVQRVLLQSNIKIELRNLSADDLDFDGMRTGADAYAGRTMFKPADFSGLAIGNMVTPGAGGNDGIWKKTTDPALAWGYVAEFDAASKTVVFNLRTV